ncbi:MAG: ATP-binding protein [Bacteroidales bacterium]|nr:ATP-binding protein [Bacteroidales bacterium]
MKNSISFSSTMDNISLVENFIDTFSSKYDVNADLYGNISIATIEAVTNAITHGNKEISSKMVNLSFELDDNLLTVTVSDQGEGFDYNNLPDPTAKENIEKTNGRGIFLIRQLSDGLEFFNNGSELVIKFKL